MTDPTRPDAHALPEAIHACQVSCRDLMQARLARVHPLNPLHTAIVYLAQDDTLRACEPLSIQ